MPEEKKVDTSIYNDEERHVLRLSANFKEMVSTDWWKEYERIIRAQIADRESVLLLPISEQHPKFMGMDFTTRAASLETIKGAIIGLRLALSIPSATITHAQDIRKEHSPTGVDEDE